MKDYVPDIDRERVDKIRRWHERAYQAALADAGTDGQELTSFGLKFRVPPDVHAITPISDLGDALLEEVRAGERVLDMGTGCGINAILAARAGADVLAVDINPEAVRAALDNARDLGVADRVEVRLSDVFDAVDEVKDGPFDLIVFDPPFRWFEPRDLLEMGTADPGYRALTRFVRDVRRYLSEDGRLLMFFGTSGDIEYFQRLLAEARFNVEVIQRRDLVTDEWEVEYFTYRITP